MWGVEACWRSCCVISDCLSVSAVLRGDLPLLAEAPLGSRRPHPAGLRGSRDFVLQAEGGCDGAAAVARHLQAARWAHLTERESTRDLLYSLSVFSAENVCSLQHLCRLRIRRCLGRLRLRSTVFMSFLPLPERLKNYILYREYDLQGWRSSTPLCHKQTQEWCNPGPTKSGSEGNLGFTVVFHSTLVKNISQVKSFWYEVKLV